MRSILPHLLLAFGISLSVCPLLIAGPIVTTRPSDLALEVEALRALDDLQVTPSQITQLSDVSANAATQAQSTDLDDVDTAADGSYVKLEGIREALLKGDPGKISEYEKILADLEEQSKISFSPRIIPSQPALQSAADIMPQFSASQISSYIAQHNEEISDPAEVLVAALTQCRGMAPRDFQPFFQDVAQQVSELVAGSAPKVRNALVARITRLLKKAHGLSAGDFDAQLPDLEGQARDIAKADSSTVLRHWVVWEIAQLLSNPKLPTALADRSAWANNRSSNSEGEK